MDKRLLGVWRSMHNRCYNTQQKSYTAYGARGIGVAAVWHGPAGFQRFLADMGPCPKGGTIEREDNDADYGPGNCRWATRGEQARNKRNNHWITAAGRTQLLADWARELGCTHTAILRRIAAGMPEAEAVCTPIPARPNAKLTEADALFVRSNYPTMTMQALAAVLGVSKKTVCNIVHGKTFSDVR